MWHKIKAQPSKYSECLIGQIFPCEFNFFYRKKQKNIRPNFKTTSDKFFLSYFFRIEQFWYLLKLTDFSLLWHFFFQFEFQWNCSVLCGSFVSDMNFAFLWVSLFWYMKNGDVFWRTYLFVWRFTLIIKKYWKFVWKFHKNSFFFVRAEWGTQFHLMGKPMTWKPFPFCIFYRI